MTLWQFSLFMLSFSLTSIVSAENLNDWDERSFKGNSVYQSVNIDNREAIHGRTEGNASILYRESTINLLDTPMLSWEWKVKNTFGNDIDERTQKGDDFPARLYVVVKTGLFPWQTSAINYVWSSNQPINSDWPNPFTDKARMVVVDTGEQHLNQWRSHRRNIKDDFKRYFDLDTDKIDGYAVMVDGDNSESSAQAWFANITFEPLP